MSLEFNKAAAAILVTGIVVMASGMIADLLVHENKLEQPAYIVEGVDRPAQTTQAAAPAPLEVPPIVPLLATADVTAGEAITRRCTVCHSFEKDGANRVGPNLWNIVNQDVAAVPGYAYSAALLGKEGQWTFESLNKYLYKPREYVPGTKMVFAGLNREQERADLIAYLRTLSDNPVPLP